jgi:rfaE bifunctional protein nucleotidyltransferase chain/domain
MKDKIKSLTELKTIVEKSREEGKMIVFTNGCFDILHTGHIRYLREAKALGDILIVGLNSDSSVKSIKGDNRPIIPEDERAEMLAALEDIDYIVIFSEDTPLNLLSTLEPDILAKGGDYKINQVVGRELVEAYGGKVIVLGEVKKYSTSDIIDRILERYRQGSL